MSPWFHRCLPIVALLTVTVACVPKPKYDDQLSENAQLRTQIAGATQALEELAEEHRKTEEELEAARAALNDKSAQAGAMEADLAQMKAAVAELERQRAQTDAALASYRDLVSRFQKMIDAGTLRVRVIDGRMVVELNTDILFPPGSATLSKDGAKAIKDVASVLASIPDREFQVAGHTDNDPIRNERFPNNWALGSGRAISVTELLVDSGLPANRVSAASYGETRPSASNATKEGKAQNRRIEIAIVPDLRAMPGYDELAALATAAPPEAAEPAAESTDKERPVKVLSRPE